jgi:uncharacterized integral membrane protein (TIGR00697 family)
MERKSKTILIALFASLLVLSNILSAKIISIGALTVPGGIICYAITFLISDIINERFGKEEGKRAIVIAFIAQILCLILISITVMLPSSDIVVSNAFNVIMQVNFWSIIGSLISFVVASSIDLYIFHRLKILLKGKYKWVWNNLSTISGQIIDTVIYVGIVFGIGQKFIFNVELLPIIAQMIISQLIVKIIFALLDTPFFYLFTRECKNKDNK